MGGIEDVMDRREFLRDSAIAAVSIPFAGCALVREDKTSLKGSKGYGLDIIVRDWKPIDVTDRIQAALPGDGNFLKDPYGPTNTSQSRNQRWRLMEYVEIPPKYWKIEKLLETEEMGKFIFDSKNEKIYTLRWQDHSLFENEISETKKLHPGANEKGEWGLINGWGGTKDVADNGYCIYSISWPSNFPSSDEAILQRVVIADIQNSRKIIFEPIPNKELENMSREGETPYFLDGLSWMIDRFSLSEEGNVLVYEKGLNYFVLDTDSYKKIFKGKGHVFGMNYDGSFLVVHRNMNYYRINIHTGKSVHLSRQDRFMRHFVFSPNGNFCACEVQDFGPSYIRVFKIDTNNVFNIDHSIKFDCPGRLEDDGTLLAVSGIYKYKNGKYRLATEGKPKPEGL